MKFTKVRKKQAKKREIRALIAMIIVFAITLYSAIFRTKNSESESSDKESIKVIAGQSYSKYHGEGVLIDKEVEKTRKWLEQKSREENEEKISPSEYKLLCKAVFAESSRNSSKENVAIAATILNRVESEEFPNSIKEVLTEKGQFSSVDYDGTVYWYPEPNRKEKLGWNDVTEQVKSDVIDALKGFDPTEESIGGALYFYSPKYASEEELTKRKNIESVQYGETIFYRE